MTEEFAAELVKRFTGEIASRLSKASALATTAQTLNQLRRRGNQNTAHQSAPRAKPQRRRPLRGTREQKGKTADEPQSSPGEFRPGSKQAKIVDLM